MQTLNLHYNHQKYPDEKINESISSILEANTLFSMATVSGEDKSYINTAYFAFGKSLNFYFLSAPTTQHCKNIAKNKSVALTIFNSNQNDPTELKRGLQIFGSSRLAAGKELIEGFAVYSQRFSSILKYIKTPADFLKKIIQSRLYIIKPFLIKIFDEPIFGQEIWLSVKVK